MALQLYKDISGLTINGSAVEGVTEIRITETFQTLEAQNNGVIDGPVGLSQIGRQFFIDITANDNAFLNVGANFCGVTIAFTAVPVLCTIYGDSTQHTYTINKMVMLSDSDSFKTKAEAEYTARFQQLSGGTIVVT